jgi:hypothetical protein
MTDLVACLSTGKGTWLEVSSLINSYNWNKVYLITNNFGKENFKPRENTELILINPESSIEEIKKAIFNELKDKLSGDVAINFSSGSGKEHMALLSALMQLGTGLRLITFDKEIKEI